MDITVTIPDECLTVVAREYGYKDTVVIKDEGVKNPQSPEDFLTECFQTQAQASYARYLERQGAAEARANAVSAANKAFTPQVDEVKETSASEKPAK